jgi:flagellar assembly protein FliH
MSSSVVKRPAGQALPKVVWRRWPTGTGGQPVARAPASAAEQAPAASVADTVRLEKDAFDRGFREGEAAAARKAQEQLQSAIQAFAQTVSTLAAYKAKLRAEVEHELVSLALAIAQKIVRRELSVDSGLILAVVKACLEVLQNAEIYRLRLNPQDLPAVAQYLQQRPARIELIPDSGITRGGALFETSQGKLDARLESQFMEIERGLADR